jgi:hypothetical protein
LLGCRSIVNLVLQRCRPCISLSRVDKKGPAAGRRGPSALAGAVDDG